jgi:hypothetical protein
LATSREVLGLGGETIWRVPPLRIPTPAGQQTAEQVAESEAAVLFAERAHAVQQDFAVTPRNAAAGGSEHEEEIFVREFPWSRVPPSDDAYTPHADLPVGRVSAAFLRRSGRDDKFLLAPL